MESAGILVPQRPLLHRAFSTAHGPRQVARARGHRQGVLANELTGFATGPNQVREGARECQRAQATQSTEYP